MGLLDDAIREHLELKRQHGAAEDEIARQEAEALGPAAEEEPERDELGEPPDGEPAREREWPFDTVSDAELASQPDEPTFAWDTRVEPDVDEPPPMSDEEAAGGLAAERASVADEPREERAETPTEDFEPVQSSAGSAVEETEVEPRLDAPEEAQAPVAGEEEADAHDEPEPADGVAGPWEPLARPETELDAGAPKAEGREGDGVELESDAVEQEFVESAASPLDAELPPEEELPRLEPEPAPDPLEGLEADAAGEIAPAAPAEAAEDLERRPEEPLDATEVASSSPAFEEHELDADPGQPTQAWSVVDEGLSTAGDSALEDEASLGSPSASLEEPRAAEGLFHAEPPSDEPDDDPLAEAPREASLADEALPPEERSLHEPGLDSEATELEVPDAHAEEPFEAAPDAYLESRPPPARHELAPAEGEGLDEPKAGGEGPAARGFFEETEEHEPVWREGDPGADPDFEN
jgi:hypothetical protein